MKSLASSSYSNSYNGLPTTRAEPIPVQTMGTTIYILPKSITFIAGEGNYSFIYTSCGKRYLVSKTLKSLTEYLDSKFIRIHKSYLVNRKYIIDRIDDDRFLKMSCGNKVAVSRRKVKEIASMLDETEYRISA